MRGFEKALGVTMCTYCHIQGDNASDDNRALADVRDLVENRHAVAITMTPGADIAALAVHLMTNSAITGATYDIDGGQQLVEG